MEDTNGILYEHSVVWLFLPPSSKYIFFICNTYELKFGNYNICLHVIGNPYKYYSLILAVYKWNKFVPKSIEIPESSLDFALDLAIC